MSNDLRTAIWNVLLSHCLVEYHDWYLSQHFSLIWPDGFTLRLYMQFINAPGHLIPDSPQALLRLIP